MSEMFNMVGEFLVNNDFPIKDDHELSGPRLFDFETFNFRHAFLLEEVAEFAKAYKENDLPEVIDALIDIIYIALGTAHMLNMNQVEFMSHFNLVHRANMRKVRATSEDQSKRGSMLDIVKPEGWKKPAHAKLLQALELYREAMKGE